MTAEQGRFEILQRYEQVEPLLHLVSCAGDSDRNALGFLPVSVYQELARKECLYLLVHRTPTKDHYVGHLLFSQIYPRARVIQLHIDPDFRRHGLAARLIAHFCTELTSAGFTSVYASVADDLIEANAFWERQQFYVQAIRLGGEAKKRKIFRRCRELDSPQLFPPSGINLHDPLGLHLSSGNEAPTFLLDLNVLFDVTGPRRTRHDKAVGLFQAERLSVCKLAISNEARDELHRTAVHGKLDPMEGFVDVLPSFPLKEFDCQDSRFTELASIVFPQKDRLTPNDESDLRHLATAIQNELAGVITNDSSMLIAGKAIRARYGIEVLSPDAFGIEQADQQGSSFESRGAIKITVGPVSDGDAPAFYEFLRRRDVSPTEIAALWFPVGGNSSIVSRIGVWAGGLPIGYMAWSDANQLGGVAVRLAVDNESDISDDAVRAMLNSLLDALPVRGPRRINLVLPPFQPAIREVAIGMGFRGVPDGAGLHKIALGGVLTAHSWASFRSQLEECSAIRLPEQIPAFHAPDQLVEIVTPSGNRSFIRLGDLETLLSPVLFCLPGRSAVITPIRKSFSEPLLGHSQQLSLLPARRVAMFSDRHYISTGRTLPHFKRGTLIFFYESGAGGGRCAIVAVARVRQAYLRRSEEIGALELDQSVLDNESVESLVKSDAKAVTVFDNRFVLPRPVPLESLRRLGCGSATQLLTTNPITSFQTSEILREAFENG